MHNLQLLKLGGSLITDKTRPHTARYDVISRLSKEIAAAIKNQPDIKLVLGHGSGSFGHVPARRYDTRSGVKTEDEWNGFVEVWREASLLNRFIIDALAAENLPAVVFSPLSSITSSDGNVIIWDLFPIQKALQSCLIPVVYGDVVFDTVKGGTILSTEDLFDYLIRQLKPRRVLLAGLERGVWGDYPSCAHLIKEITPRDSEQIIPGIQGSSAPDVTGGMLNKVQQSLQWVQYNRGMEVLIFSGEEPGTLERVLLGGQAGTRILL